MVKKKGKLAIIDADSFLFFAGWHYKDSLTMIGALAAKEHLDKMITATLNDCGATHYIGFFGKDGAKNFRYDWATIKPYKGNRKSEDWVNYFRPILKEHYEKKWGFHPCGEIEADDAVVIAFHQFKDKWDIIAVEEDKDGRQKGEFLRFNPSTRSNPGRKLEKMKHEEGRKFFYSQLIMGDSSDNIGGIAGQGKKSKLIETLNEMENPTEEEMFQFVRDAYMVKYGDEWEYHMVENYMLLKMLDKPSFDYPEQNKLNIVEWKKPKKNGPSKLINL